jgi:hypothetical protein
MVLEELRLTVREIVDQLVRGDYEAIVRRCIRSRLTSDDLRKVLHDYGRKLVSPPGDAYDNLDAVQVQDASISKWSIRSPLWTEEEGRSDLTLELTIAVGDGEPKVELDDLHVL